MHGEAADKPRYSFNFRVGLGKKEKAEKRRGGREKKWERRAHEKGKCSARRGGRRRRAFFLERINAC